MGSVQLVVGGVQSLVGHIWSAVCGLPLTLWVSYSPSPQAGYTGIGSSLLRLIADYHWLPPAPQRLGSSLLRLIADY